MAGGKEIKAGKAFVEISTRDRLSKGLLAAQKKLKAFGAAVRSIGVKLLAIGTSAAVAIGAAVKSFANVGSELHDMALRTGVSAKALSELGYVAGQTGAEMGALELGIKGMQKNLLAARDGSKEINKALAEVGLTFKELDGLDPAKQFEMIGVALAKVQDPSTRAALAMKLLGKSGADLLPMFAELEEGLERVRRLGLGWTDKEVALADELGDRLSDLWATMKRLRDQIAIGIGPAVLKIVKPLQQALTRALNWAKANPKLAQSIAVVTGVVITLGSALIVMGTAATLASQALSGLTGIATLASTVISAAANPFGLLMSALVVGAGAALYYSGALDSLKNTAVESFAGIKAAISAGDWAGAAAIATAGIKLEWVKLVQSLNEIWIGLKLQFLSAMNDAWNGTASLLIDGWAALKDVWSGTTAFLGMAWDVFCEGIISAFEGVANFIEKTWLRIRGIANMLFGTKFEADALFKQANEVGNDPAKKDRLANKLGERAGKWGMERQQTEEDRKTAQSDLQAQHAADQKKLEDEIGAQLAGAGKDVEQATADWQKAVADAKAKGAEAKPEEALFFTKSGTGSGESPAQQSLKGAGAAGVFGGAGVSDFGGGRSPIPKTLEDIRKLNKLQYDEQKKARKAAFVAKFS